MRLGVLRGRPVLQLSLLGKLRCLLERAGRFGQRNLYREGGQPRHAVLCPLPVWQRGQLSSGVRDLGSMRSRQFLHEQRLFPFRTGGKRLCLGRGVHFGVLHRWLLL